MNKEGQVLIIITSVNKFFNKILMQFCFSLIIVANVNKSN